MPFQRKSDWEFSWEKEAKKGNLFIKPITANNMFVYWTRALRAVSGRKKPGKAHSPDHTSDDNTATDPTTPKPGRGILLIRYHDKPKGILAAPGILRSVLLDWNGNEAIPVTLSEIQGELVLLADSAKPDQLQPFRPRTMGVRIRPHSIAALWRDLGQAGGIAAVFKYRDLYAFLVPLPLLARFRLEARQQSAQEWRTSVLNWLFQVGL